MKQDEFRKWLVVQGQTDATASSRVSSAKRVEQHLGDLDGLFAQEDRDSVLNRFAYTAEDERAERPNPFPVPIDGILRTGLASLQQSLKLYHSFLTEQSSVPDKAAHQALLDRLTRKEIDAAMQECDQLGLKAFLARGGFASPQVWVTDEGNDQSDPAKATVAAALGHLPQGCALTAKEFFNGFGEAQSFATLEALGIGSFAMGPPVGMTPTLATGSKARWMHMTSFAILVPMRMRSRASGSPPAIGCVRPSRALTSDFRPSRS